MKFHPMIELPVRTLGDGWRAAKPRSWRLWLGGVITIEEACRRYHMSEEEFFGWRRAFENGGIASLRQKRQSIRFPRPGPRHSAGLTMTRPHGLKPASSQSLPETRLLIRTAPKYARATVGGMG
jgi:hypothetical protein